MITLTCQLESHSFSVAVDEVTVDQGAAGAYAFALCPVCASVTTSRDADVIATAVALGAMDLRDTSGTVRPDMLAIR